MKVVVCGGRDYDSPAHVWHDLNILHEQYKFTDLMQGGARGVDKFAKEWAATKPEIKRHVCRAQWDRYGNAAGPMRNARMMEWEPDFVIAFPGGKGTANLVKQAHDSGYKLFRRELVCHVYSKEITE